MKLLRFLRIGLALASVFAGGLTSSAAAAKPNIIFIITDQQFGDALSCRMGSQYLKTPNLDGLAKQGVFFTRAYSANPLCMPFRNSVFTGRYPHETKITSNDTQPLDTAEFVCMGTYFKQAGYETAYAGKWHLCFNKKSPEAHGFEIIGAEEKTGHDVNVTSAAKQFFAKKHDKPFLLVLSYLNPHNICEYSRRLSGATGQVLTCGEVGNPPPASQLPPPPFNWAIPRNEPDTMTMVRKGEQATTLFPVGAFSEDTWRQHRWGYYRMIELVDAEIGQSLAAMRQAGCEENTLIIMTSDHGECAGAHHFNQKTVFYDESARVPLIVSGKGKTKAATSDKLVNTGIDILPTMMEFAGIAQPKKLPGRSLAPLVLGNTAAAWRDYVVIQNHMVQTTSVGNVHPTAQGRMVRSERFKYCVYDHGNQRESLVDMQADPGELNDLAADPKYRDVVMQHRELLTQWGREHNDPLVAAMLADNVKPIPFTADAPGAQPTKFSKKEKKKKK